jgi:hypothetical protein
LELSLYDCRHWDDDDNDWVQYPDLGRSKDPRDLSAVEYSSDLGFSDEIDTK